MWLFRSHLLRTRNLSNSCCFCCRDISHLLSRQHKAVYFQNITTRDNAWRAPCQRSCHLRCWSHPTVVHLKFSGAISWLQSTGLTKTGVCNPCFSIFFVFQQLGTVNAFVRSSLNFCPMKFAYYFITITTDYGAKTCRGVCLLSDQLSHSRFHIRWTNHVVNIFVKVTLNKVHVCISPYGKLISAIRVSFKRRERFEELRGVLNAYGAKLSCLDVDTRRSSTFSML